jgi:hypothetical protein
MISMSLTNADDDAGVIRSTSMQLNEMLRELYTMLPNPIKNAVIYNRAPGHGRNAGSRDVPLPGRRGDGSHGLDRRRFPFLVRFITHDLAPKQSGGEARA